MPRGTEARGGGTRSLSRISPTDAQRSTVHAKHGRVGLFAIHAISRVRCVSHPVSGDIL